MIKDRINYSESIETIQPNGLKRWVRAELSATINEHESVFKGWQELKDDVQAFLKPSMVPIEEALQGVLPEVQIDRTPVEKRQLLLDIDSATCLRLPDGKGGLLQWQHVVKGDKELEAAFNQKHDELKKYLQW